jgi:hypothetical protein
MHGVEMLIRIKELLKIGIIVIKASLYLSPEERDQRDSNF